ncbi:DUF6221 family protein [Cellulomonas sp. Marseille-Q8402]
MTTLPEFLLERIAEDEAAVMNADLHTDRGRRKTEVEPWLLLSASDPWVTEHTGGLPLITMSEARARAECEAKRRIVGTITKHDRIGYDYSGPILELLALPYADHPDYREEWRP